MHWKPRVRNLSWKSFFRTIKYEFEESVLNVELCVENLSVESLNLCRWSLIWVLSLCWKSIPCSDLKFMIKNLIIESWNLCWRLLVMSLEIFVVNLCLFYFQIFEFWNLYKKSRCRVFMIVFKISDLKFVSKVWFLIHNICVETFGFKT